MERGEDLSGYKDQSGAGYRVDDGGVCNDPDADDHHYLHHHSRIFIAIVICLLII